MAAILSQSTSDHKKHSYDKLLNLIFLSLYFSKKKKLHYHFDRRRDFPEPGPPDTSRGGIGAGAATRSFSRSKYCKRDTTITNTSLFKEKIYCLLL